MRRPLVAGLALAGLVLVTLVVWSVARAGIYDVGALARRAPERTALMRQREQEARREGRTARIERHWVDFERISPRLRRAVLVAEDDRFFSHQGLDWTELQESARRNVEERRVARGGSTITQQLAKNVFLGSRRTPARKLTELFVALRMERELSKRRILELYLNLIEWGPGVYGAEAAARHWYGKPASALDAREAVRLAAVIINPRRYSPIEPSKRIERRARTIARRMRRRGWLTEAEFALVTGGVMRADTLATTGSAADSFVLAADSAAVADEIVMEPGAEPLPPADTLSLPAPP